MAAPFRILGEYGCKTISISPPLVCSLRDHNIKVSLVPHDMRKDTPCVGTAYAAAMSSHRRQELHDHQESHSYMPIRQKICASR